MRSVPVACNGEVRRRTPRCRAASARAVGGLTSWCQFILQFPALARRCGVFVLHFLMCFLTCCFLPGHAVRPAQALSRSLRLHMQVILDRLHALYATCDRHRLLNLFRRIHEARQQHFTPICRHTHRERLQTGSASNAAFTLAVSAESVVYSPADSCVGVDEHPAVIAIVGTAQATARMRRVRAVFVVGIVVCCCWKIPRRHSAVTTSTAGFVPLACSRQIKVLGPNIASRANDCPEISRYEPVKFA